MEDQSRMAVPEALTRFPQSISGLVPGLRQERIGLWSSFPGPRLDSVGAQGLRTTFPWVFWGFYGKYKIFI